MEHDFGRERVEEREIWEEDDEGIELEDGELIHRKKGYKIKSKYPTNFAFLDLQIEVKRIEKGSFGYSGIVNRNL